MSTTCIEHGINPPVPDQQLTIEELKVGFGGVSVRPGKILCMWNEENGYTIKIDENMAI